MFVTYLEASLSYAAYFALFLVLLLVLSRFIKKKPFSTLNKIVSKHSIVFAAIVATVAFLGSMSFSNIAMYKPCLLCWYQRIAIFPQFILLWIGYARKEQNIKWYALPLLIIGLLISGYQWFLQLFPPLSDGPCGLENSCVGRYIYEYGFMSIPGMAFSACLLIITLLFIHSSTKKHVTK